MRSRSYRTHAINFYMIGTFVMKELKNRSFEDKRVYNKERNYCVSLVRKTQKNYYNNFDHKKFVDNKSVWKYIKCHFTNMSSSFNKIILVDKDLIWDRNEEIAKTFNHFYTWVVSHLNIPQYEDPSMNFE